MNTVSKRFAQNYALQRTGSNHTNASGRKNLANGRIRHRKFVDAARHNAEGTISQGRPKKEEAPYT